ncbi:hypothetical protein NDN08_004836 [Rhodosorus marinus]|uniref:Uncharacterized protein n=1 Tax=Rhodosorus marinus TaxID=101924 RepID=A0AAV8UQG7_9RHOD|nr:hypothetical protein NDN08_004836 [Rhodosorus marinus]
MGTEYIDYAMRCGDHAGKLWTELQKVFRSARIENKFRLIDSFHSFEMDSEIGMRENVKKFNCIRMEFELLGEDVNNTQAIFCLLKSLPRDYETFAEIQRSQRDVPMVAEVTEKLLAEEQGRAHRNREVDRRPEATAMAAQKRSPRNSANAITAEMHDIGRKNAGGDYQTMRGEGVKEK